VARERSRRSKSVAGRPVLALVGERTGGFFGPLLRFACSIVAPVFLRCRRCAD
jgi:hypothetical protein